MTGQGGGAAPAEGAEWFPLGWAEWLQSGWPDWPPSAETLLLAALAIALLAGLGRAGWRGRRLPQGVRDLHALFGEGLSLATPLPGALAPEVRAAAAAAAKETRRLPAPEPPAKDAALYAAITLVQWDGDVVTRVCPRVERQVIEAHWSMVAARMDALAAIARAPGAALRAGRWAALGWAGCLTLLPWGAAEGDGQALAAELRALASPLLLQLGAELARRLAAWGLRAWFARVAGRLSGEDDAPGPSGGPSGEPPEDTPPGAPMPRGARRRRARHPWLFGVLPPRGAGGR